jgi:hypothetical protein
MHLGWVLFIKVSLTIVQSHIRSSLTLNLAHAQPHYRS